MRCAVSSRVARSTHDMHHAIVEVNIVIGVVLGELHVVVCVHVPLVVVCDEAVVRRTLGLIALVVIVVFVVAMFHRILLYWRYTVYKNLRHVFDGLLLHLFMCRKPHHLDGRCEILRHVFDGLLLHLFT